MGETARCAAGHEYVRGNGCRVCSKAKRAEQIASYEAKRRQDAERKAYQRAWAAAHRDEINARAKARRAAKPKPEPKRCKCVICGRDFESNYFNAKLCSDGCKKEQARRKEKERRYAKRLAEVGRTHEERVCAECGKSFTVAVAGPERGRGALPECCSTRCARRCARRHGSHYRGVRVTDAERKRIYLRDGCRCQLCGGKVRLDLDPLDPMAPTLDHILPRAKGGKDEARNLQLAHRKCNTNKRERGEGRLGAQTLLFG